MIGVPAFSKATEDLSEHFLLLRSSVLRFNPYAAWQVTVLFFPASTHGEGPFCPLFPVLEEGCIQRRHSSGICHSWLGSGPEHMFSGISGHHVLPPSPFAGWPMASSSRLLTECTNTDHSSASASGRISSLFGSTWQGRNTTCTLAFFASFNT